MFSEEEYPPIKSYKKNLSREAIKRSTRILFVDDEEVPLIENLKNEGFSVDHDKSGNDISRIENGYFDLIILDYKGVGSKYGPDEGLSLLKSIKRVNPSVYVLTYTSQNLPPSKSSEFYSLSDGSINKDASVTDSISRIEEALRQTQDPELLWSAIIKLRNISAGSVEAHKLEQKFVKFMIEKKKSSALGILEDNDSGIGSSLVEKIVDKLFSLTIEQITGI